MQPPSGGRPFVFVLTRAALGRRTSRRIRAPPRRMPRLLAQLRWLAFGDSWFNAKRSKYPPTSRGAKVRAPRRAALAPEGAPRTPQPGDRTRTHGAAQPAETAACGASRRAPSPSLLTSCTPHSLRRAVWRTHTHTEGGAARGGRGGTRPHDTHSGPCSWRAGGTGDGHTAARHALLRSGRTGGVSARPRTPTAHNCMAHPVPHTTRQRHPRRPAPRGLHNWAFAPGHRCPRTDQPRSSGYASHGSSAARAPKPAPAAAHHKTARARRSPLSRRPHTRRRSTQHTCTHGHGTHAHMHTHARTHTAPLPLPHLPRVHL